MHASVLLRPVVCMTRAPDPSTLDTRIAEESTASLMTYIRYRILSAPSQCSELLACVKNMCTCRDVRRVQREVQQSGKPLEELCARGLCEPQLAAQWQANGLEQTPLAYVQWLLQNAVQQEALRHIRRCLEAARKAEE